jgi:hypothetical protein
VLFTIGATLSRRVDVSISLVAGAVAYGVAAFGLGVLAAIAAAIGLLPTPGGAYINAVVVDPLYDKMGLKSHQNTFLNYWMRHIWIPVWPLFQGVLITAAVLGVSVWEVVEWAWRSALSAAAAGVAVAASLVKPVPVAGEPRGQPSDLSPPWPRSPY